MQFINSVLMANLEIINYINTSSSLSDYEKFTKGSGGDISRGIDLKAENIFIKYLKEYGQIYSEECGLYGTGKDKIIIDPIDGSSNFISGLPYFGTSVARSKDKKIIDAIIVNLANNEVFIKNSKFFLRGKLDNNFDLNKFVSVKTNDFSTEGIFERAYKAKNNSLSFLRSLKIKYRSPGALALSLAYAHDVNFILYEGKVREFDVAAGWYMAEDLHRYKNDKFLLISKSKEIFDIILKFYIGG